MGVCAGFAGVGSVLAGVVCVMRSGRSGASGMTGSVSRDGICGAEGAGVVAVGFWVEGCAGVLAVGVSAGVAGGVGSASRERSCGAEVAGVEPASLVEEPVDAGASGLMELRLRRARNAGAALGATSTGRGAEGAAGGVGSEDDARAPGPVVTPGMTPKALRSGSLLARPAVGLITGVPGHASAGGGGVAEAAGGAAGAGAAAGVGAGEGVEGASNALGGALPRRRAGDGSGVGSASGSTEGTRSFQFIRRETRGFSGVGPSSEAAGTGVGRLGFGGSTGRSITPLRTSLIDGMWPTGRDMDGFGITGAGAGADVGCDVRGLEAAGLEPVPKVGPVDVGSSSTMESMAGRSGVLVLRLRRTDVGEGGVWPVARAVTPDRTSPETRRSTPWRTSGLTTVVGRRVTSIDDGG